MASFTDYLVAENLKLRRTFARKLIVIAPAVLLVLACVQMGYFTLNLFNWWYTMIFPGFITLAVVLIEQHEGGKLAYRALLPLPVDLRRVWAAKMVIAVVYAALSTAVLTAGLLVVTGIFSLSGGISLTSVDAVQLAKGAGVIVVTSLWQIPLCLLLSCVLGMAATLAINLVGGIVAGIACASEVFWWVCPWSWTMRLMVPLLGTLPNGLIAEPGDALLDAGVVPVGVILSLVLFGVLAVVVTRVLAAKEVA